MEEPSDDEEVEIIAVVESPAKHSGTKRKDANLQYSGHEKARRKLSQLGNVSITRSSSMETETGGDLPEIRVKKEDKGN